MLLPGTDKDMFMCEAKDRVDRYYGELINLIINVDESNVAVEKYIVMTNSKQ